MTKLLFRLGFLILLFPGSAFSQDDLLQMLGNEKPELERVTSAFKSTRVIGSHSIEHLAAGVLDFRIMHRFGPFNSGGYEFFGLDQATIRIGFDYGITDRLTVGFGRSSLYKELDGFLKYRVLWQSKGAKNIPLSIIAITGMTCNMVKWQYPDRQNYTSSRLGYYYQVLLGRKFSDHFTFQLGPIMVHRNLVKTAEDHHDVFALELGTRVKILQRIALTADYFHVFPGQLPEPYSSPLSLGIDIETGGHVFQIHFTNAPAMNEKTFITETTGKWSKGDIHLGFNISRVFTLSSRNRDVQPEKNE